MNVQENVITIGGSAQMIADYLRFAMNNLLFQRGVYPPNDFTPIEKYGIPIYMSQNHGVCEFFDKVLQKAEEWTSKKMVKSVIFVIHNVATKEIIERWDFQLKYEEGNPSADGTSQVSYKPLPKIQGEIRDVMRQITSTISFLPVLEQTCAFDVYIERDGGDLPEKWEEMPDVVISNSQTVKMRGFSTGIHELDTFVTYKLMP
ncbi:mitotic spindle assembly checkpoint protein MAD2A-like [Anopheles cruzii]|uniref:mitotic spindle assembly checkpoint protein MAD2A-like n=1 Tax=Anopheles cruzii TaxID=68878 RepID=UPI0022EC34BD|nr:mitotic spindle assembly checkpoint protein MAD2A-like [Anopheles cruzii]